MSRMLTASTWMLALLALSACAPEPTPPPDASAQLKPPVPVEKPAEKPVPNPSPEEVLQQAAAFFAQVKTLQVRSDKDIQIEFNGRRNQATAQSALSAERPNRFALENTDQQSQVTLLSDGETLTTHVPSMKKFVEVPAPGTFDDLERNQQFIAFTGGTVPAPLLLLTSDPQAVRIKDVTSSAYVGREQLHGSSVHHLKYEQKPQLGGFDVEFELWVAAEGDPLVLQVRRTMSSSRVPQMMKNVVTETFHDWKFDEPIEPETFAFTPPEGAEKVDSLFAAAGNRPGSPPQKPEPPPIPSSGNPVIDFFRAVDRGVKSTTPENMKREAEPGDAEEGNKPPQEE